VFSHLNFLFKEASASLSFETKKKNVS